MDTTSTQAQPLIYPYQQPAYDRLSAIARAYININFERFLIKPRGNVFIVGPSGTGKTHLAQQIAVGADMDLAYLPISVSEWIIMGSGQRAGMATLPTICELLLESSQREGCIIYLDELDKVGRHTQSDWTRFQTTEVFSLLDRRLPRNIKDTHGDKIHPHKIEEAESILRSKTLILAGGAFQNFWENKSNIGFGSESEANPKLDLNHLEQSIPPELARRFGSQLVTLPPLQETDYLDMLALILQTLPDYWQGTYESMALDGIPEAARLGQGPRYFEELLLEVAIQVRQSMVSATPPEIAIRCE